MNQDQNPDVLIQVQDTPNPSAWKFILNRPILKSGKASFNSVEEAHGNILSQEILRLPGVQQVHLFANVITVTSNDTLHPEDLKSRVVSIIQTRISVHNPDYNPQEAKADLRKHLPEEVQKIESILDRTIRPGLQGDGGDIEVIKYEDPKLYVLYQGACGTCPSATQGTLMAIEGILRDEFKPDIEVIPV